MKRGAAPAFGLSSGFVAIALLPFLPAITAGVPGLSAFGALLDGWFRFQCERDPSRTFAGLAVCARCLGIYVGFGLGGALGRPAVETGALRVWIGTAALLILADVLSEALAWRSESAALRLATGALLAYPVGLAVRGAVLTYPS